MPAGTTSFRDAKGGLQNSDWLPIADPPLPRGIRGIRTRAGRTGPLGTAVRAGTPDRMGRPASWRCQIVARTGFRVAAAARSCSGSIRDHRHTAADSPQHIGGAEGLRLAAGMAELRRTAEVAEPQSTAEMAESQHTAESELQHMAEPEAVADTPEMAMAVAAAAVAAESRPRAAGNPGSSWPASEVALEEVAGLAEAGRMAQLRQTHRLAPV